MHEDLIIILLAIAIHYAIEYGNNLGDYTCPDYCKVKHEHKITKEKLDELTRDDGISFFQR